MNWGSQPGRTNGIVAVPWSDTVLAMPAYVHRITENRHSAARRVCDNLLQENRTERMQSPSTSRSILCDRLVNQQGCVWDVLRDEPVDQ